MEAYVIVVQVDVNGQIRYFILTSGNDIAGWKTEEEALKYFEDTYNRKHRSGYEASMSVCINWLSFHPSIIKTNADTQGDLKRLVGPPPDDGYRKVTVHNIAGSITGVECKGENIANEWEHGTKPRLISEETFVGGR